ncbi:DUF2267 domain-containing protein [Actinopolymorpha alba]|uniref:DUF2267 domain-containing protein n=1 Tax=Actinopolymorpha alba TaxID=533267 RepID=UPI00036DEDBA|nr:DUF2267 domain-containing protein [Actinopolymorpha alba]
MDYERFLSLVVAADGGRDAEAAERSTRATLETLADRLPVGEARDLVEELSPELGPWLFTSSPAEELDVHDFVGRIAEREEVDLATAARHARAVFIALSQALDADEFAAMVSQLSSDFVIILPER